MGLGGVIAPPCPGGGHESESVWDPRTGPGGGLAPMYPGPGDDFDPVGLGGGPRDPHSATEAGPSLEGPLAPLYRFWRPVLTADAAVADLYFPWWQERAW